MKLRIILNETIYDISPRFRKVIQGWKAITDREQLSALLLKAKSAASTTSDYMVIGEMEAKLKGIPEDEPEWEAKPFDVPEGMSTMYPGTRLEFAKIIAAYHLGNPDTLKDMLAVIERTIPQPYTQEEEKYIKRIRNMAR